MAITTLAGVGTAARQRMQYSKTGTGTLIAAAWFTLFDVPGNPGAGTLNVGNTANGLVPTDATAGCPDIYAMGGTGLMANIGFGSVQPGRYKLVDRLFHAGAYSFNSAVTLASQPSYSGRVPGGTDFSNTEIWIETVTAFTGNMSIAVTYTNQSGTAARTTGTVALGIAPTLRRMIQLPLQAGDTGVQKIESVTATVATVGTFNVLVLRPLWIGRVIKAFAMDYHGLDKIGTPEVFATSALQVIVAPDGTTSSQVDFFIDIING